MKQFKQIKLLVAAMMTCMSVGAVMPAASAADDGTTTVICVGDSLTEGRDAGSTEANPTWNNSYPNQLRNRLGMGYDVLNYGKGGASLCVSCQGYKGLPEFKDSLEQTDPEYIIIMIGTNDCNYNKFSTDEEKVAFKADYADLIDIYREQYRDAKFILISAPPMKTGNDGGRNEIYQNVQAPIVKAVAAEKGCDFVNGYELVLNSPEYAEEGDNIYSDTTHFMKKGYKIFADKVYELIKADETTANVSADYTSDGKLSLIFDSPVASANIYVASYNSEGRLDKVSTFGMTNIDAYKSYVKDVNNGFTKSFIWSSDGNMTPLANASDIGSRFTQSGTQVTVSGKTFAGKTMPHAICVKDSNGTVVYAGQVNTAQDGSYVHTFDMPQSAAAGNYTVLSSSFGAAISETFNYTK